MGVSGGRAHRSSLRLLRGDRLLGEVLDDRVDERRNSVLRRQDGGFDLALRGGFGRDGPDRGDDRRPQEVRRRFCAHHFDEIAHRRRVILFDPETRRHHRNVVVFADGEVDRSPTGSATSARTALLADDGLLGEGASWRNESIVGTAFRASVVGRAPEGVLTEVEGTAYRTGEHRFVLDPRDDLGTGFVLR